MAELLQQNKRMENMVSSMSSEMKALRQEVNQLKQAPALVRIGLLFPSSLS